MQLKGEIATFSLSSVLQLLYTEKKSGLLRVFRDKEEYQIFFLNGNVIYGIQSRKEARLGFLLIQYNEITQKQLDFCLDVARNEKQAIGKVLVERGLITIETLEKYLYMQVEEIIVKLFLWENGNFEYKDLKLNLKWLTITKINVMKLVMEGTRKADENTIMLKNRVQKQK